MIADNGRHYLYRHISLYGKVFYIGIGTKLNKPKGFNSHSTEYSRAYCKSKRNLEWYEESKNEYRIEILLESDSYNFIKEKEKEFIKLYKRIKDKGTLINKNAGGQGTEIIWDKKIYDEIKELPF